MSLQVTLARGVSREAESAWRWHKDGCPKCAHRRDRCRDGESAWQEWQDARGELARQRELDKQPPPNQGVLF